MLRRPLVVLCLLAMAFSAAHAAEITFQAWKYAMPAEEQYYRDLIPAFAADHPGDKVRFQFDSWDDAHDRMAEWLKTGTGPDLMVVCDMWLTEFAPYLVPYVDDMPEAKKA